jgi:hypothetical protein
MDTGGIPRRKPEELGRFPVPGARVVMPLGDQKLLS